MRYDLYIYIYMCVCVCVCVCVCIYMALGAEGLNKVGMNIKILLLSKKPADGSQINTKY